MKKRIVAVLLAGMMVVGMAGCSNSASTDSKGTDGKEASGETIKVGVIYSATGTMAGRGEYMKNAIELAAEEINEAGGVLDKDIELVYEDDQSDQTTAINMMNKMGSDEEIVAVFGPHTSTNAIAVSNTVEDYGIPYFTGGTSAKLKSLGNEYMFKVRCNDTVVVNSAMKFVSESLDAKKIGILYINDEFGVGGRDIMVKYCEDNNLEFVEANHNATDQDLTSQIMKMKQENVDVLVAWSSNVCPIVARQTTELGFDKPVLMNSGFGGQDVLDSLSTEYTEGKYAACDFTAEDPTEEAAAFVKAFSDAYGKKPLGDWSASYYGGLKALASAIEAAGKTDRESIKDAMYNVKDFAAPLGALTTDENGCLVHETSVIQAVVQDDGKAIFDLVEKIKESGY
ncbi:ABC transporter substrate-binding protein [Anaerobium acetethylicum]|uniref:Branched-chain amino acid transport system substrate-binding protein n=1 Tax=Anaerobium acetethylicum TaxID=1619234 RepID=A0A1D3TYP3_9FIRM|nr:ABC transporter substrate-binding protein [Anaerobium acetethylicum]SCP99592.1 branched-chain amino acid transport system substrate-binding protein [Anaerobium acetethylicum]